MRDKFKIYPGARFIHSKYSKFSKLSNLSSFSNLSKRQTMIIAVIGIVVLAGLSKLLYQYFGKPADMTPPPLLVQTIKVKEGPMPELIETVGSLTSKKHLKIKAGSVGRVQQILVESGAWVKAGTLLAHIIASPEVRAPFDGYLTDWQVKSGEYVAAGSELVDIVNTESLQLTYRVPEKYADKLEENQTVEVSVKAFPDKTFSGTVIFISPVVDRKTYTVLMKAEIKNPDQALWPGMSAHIKHILTNNPNALVIPEACLNLTMEGYEVFVVLEGKLQKRAVTLGARRAGRVQILSGLHLNDSIILARTTMMEEGSAVTATEWTGEW